MVSSGDGKILSSVRLSSLLALYGIQVLSDTHMSLEGRFAVGKKVFNVQRVELGNDFLLKV